jgi:FkbM family methyltransferase
MWRLLRRLRIVASKIFRPKRATVSGVILDAASPALDAAARQQLYDGSYELLEARIVEKTLERGETVVEFGAGIGFISTLCAKRVGPHGRVIAFEANPYMEPVIRGTYALNGVQPELVMGAIAEGAQTVTFNVSKTFLSSSRAKRGDDMEQVVVPAHTLDEIITRFKPTYIVADIEGAEAVVFSNSSLDGVRKMCLELHPHIVGHGPINAMVDHLRRQGFAVHYDLAFQKRVYLARP